LVLTKNPMSAGIMYPKRAWTEAGGYPEAMRWGREDWAFNVALMLKDWCGVHIDEAGYLYRRERQNRSLRTGNRHHDEASGYDPTPDGTQTWHEFFRNQLRELYPEAYEGGQMASCCGERRSRKTSKPTPVPASKAVSVPASLPGKAGMTRLEYIGKNAGDSTWWGLVTNTRYVFGGNRRVGYVDSQDVAGMLAMKKDDKPVFRRYKEPAKPKAPPVVEEKAPDPPVTTRALEVPDIQSLTGAEIKALDIIPNQVLALIKQEQVGKNRKTVLAYLESLSYV